MQWGPIYWKFLHGIVKHKHNKQHHGRFVYIMNALAFILPCSICRSNYLLKLIDSPVPQKESKETLQRWLVSLHNEVNRDLGKPILPYTKAVLGVSTQINEALKMFILITQYNIQYNVKDKKLKKDMQIVFTNVKDHLKILFPGVQFTGLQNEERCKKVRAMRV